MKPKRVCECCNEPAPDGTRLRRCRTCERWYCIGCKGEPGDCGKCWQGTYDWISFSTSNHAK